MTSSCVRYAIRATPGVRLDEEPECEAVATSEYGAEACPVLTTADKLAQMR